MKMSVKILVLIPAVMFAQDWKPDVLALHKVEKASVYWQVPESNPEYYTEPKGLMMVTEKYFDSLGRLTKSFTPNGLAASHGPSYDIVETYIYESGRLKFARKVSNDTVNIEYVYDENLTLEFQTNPNGERTGVVLTEADGQGRIEKTTEARFKYQTERDSLIRFQFKKYKYGGSEKKEWFIGVDFYLKPEDLRTLHTSRDAAEFQKLFPVIWDNRRIGPLSKKRFGRPYAIYKYDRAGFLISTRFLADDSTVTYSYDKGLPSKTVDVMGIVYSIVSEYRYVFRQ